MKKLILIPCILGVSAVSYLTYSYLDGDTKGEGEVVIEEKAKEYVTDPNLGSSLQTFLNKWIDNEGEELHKMMLSDFDNFTGSLVYGAEIVEIDKTASLNLGISQLTINSNILNTYEGLGNNLAPSNENSNGVAIVTYENSEVIKVDFYTIDAPLEDIRDIILNSDLTPSKEVNKEINEEEAKSYENMLVTDWKSLAELTSNSYVSKGLTKPKFIIPSKNIDTAEDLTNNFNYIIVGEVKSSEEGLTTLRTSGDLIINLDFKIDKAVLDKPSWIHVLVHDGQIQSVNQQVFDKASYEIMINGVLDYQKSSE